MKPFAVDETSVTGARFAGDADFETTWRLCEYAERIEYSIDWILAAGPAPAGSFQLWGNGDVGAIAGLTPAAAQSVLIPAPAGSAGVFGAWPTVAGAPPQNASIVVAHPMRWHQVRFVRTGGGAAGQFKVTCTITPRSVQ